MKSHGHPDRCRCHVCEVMSARPGPLCAHCQVGGTLTWRFGGKPLHDWCVSDFLHSNAVANPALKVVHV